MSSASHFPTSKEHLGPAGVGLTVSTSMTDFMPVLLSDQSFDHLDCYTCEYYTYVYFVDLNILKC